MITEKKATVKFGLNSEVYAQYSNETLIKAYLSAPQRIREVITGLTEQEMKARPIPGKWSIAEIIIHLADGEIIGACRMRQAYCEHPDPFPYYMEDDWAKILRYQEKDMFHLMEQLSLFELLRKTTGELLNKCTEHDWAKNGVHPQRGKMNLRGLLELYADHGERHIVQILERRALLGKLLKMEIILTDRLY